MAPRGWHDTTVEARRLRVAAELRAAARAAEEAVGSRSVTDPTRIALIARERVAHAGAVPSSLPLHRRRIFGSAPAGPVSSHPVDSGRMEAVRAALAASREHLRQAGIPDPAERPARPVRAGLEEEERRLRADAHAAAELLPAAAVPEPPSPPPPQQSESVRSLQSSPHRAAPPASPRRDAPPASPHRAAPPASPHRAAPPASPPRARAPTAEAESPPPSPQSPSLSEREDSEGSSADENLLLDLLRDRERGVATDGPLAAVAARMAARRSSRPPPPVTPTTAIQIAAGTDPSAAGLLHGWAAIASALQFGDPRRQSAEVGA